MNSQYTNTFLMNCYQGVANGWAGVPLISTAKRRPPRNKSTNGSGGFKSIDAKDSSATASSMSKMALHAHGAPLILTNSGGSAASTSPQGPRNGNGFTRYRNKSSSSATTANQNASTHRMQPMLLNGGHHQYRVSASDSTNIINCERNFVTDENSSILSNSSSSASSSSGSPMVGDGLVGDACLPRIIKPRKRRKKERKPGSHTGHMSGGDATGDLAGSNHPKTSEEDDFEDDDALVTSNCSCRLCDPNSHIWSFPLRRVCSLETSSDNSFPDPMNGNDLYPLHHHQQATKSQNKSSSSQAKDVGVIGGNRVNQQRNEWRGSPARDQQLHLSLVGDECDNDLLGAEAVKLDNGMTQRDTTGMPLGILDGPRGYVHGGGVLFGRWPSMLENEQTSSKSGDEDSSVDFSCNNVGFAGDDAVHRSNSDSGYCGLRGNSANSDEDEELLIENLANLLNVNNKSVGVAKDSLSKRSSDSSGVSSASDCGSVFGECYSPLGSLGSPPSFAFNFPPTKGSGLFPMPIDHGLLEPDLQLMIATGTRSVEEQQQQHVLNCLDMDWYRAATTNRRLLMPYSNN